MKVDFYRHSLGDAERASLEETLGTWFLTTAGKTARFEQEFARLLGVERVVGLNSCTAALHMSLVGLGIGPGDEVIVPAMTFVASIIPIWWVGATPVLVDVDPVSGLLEPEQVARALTPRTRAVIPVHLYGNMVDMRSLRELADSRGFFLLEDSAHCVEGTRDGIGPGQLGDVACFSFYATKNLTSGEGGCLATNNRELADRISRIRTFAMTKNASERQQSESIHWDMGEMGYKCGMYDLQAALLLPQLPGMGLRLARREQICRRYEEAFAGLEGLDFPRVPQGAVSARHLFTIWVPEQRRDDLILAFRRDGVGCTVNYQAPHTLDYFRQRLGLAEQAFPNALAIGKRTISLPLYPGLTDGEVEHVVEVVSGYFR